MLMAPCTEIPMLSIANKIVRVSKAKSQCTCEFAVCACRMHGRPFGMQSNFQPRGPGPKNSNALPRIFGGHGKACLGMTKGQWAMRASLACPHGKCFGGCLFYCAWCISATSRLPEGRLPIVGGAQRARGDSCRVGNSRP